MLLVDAELDRAHAVRDGLAATGAEVVAILRDATDLPAQVRAHAADVVVCDMDHPTRDALDSMRLLHRDEPRPVVMFVDRSAPEQTAAAIEAGVAAYVIEGLEPKRVAAVVQVAVARFAADRALRAELSEARSALIERKLVERAKGILMRSKRVPEEEAYRMLRKLAMDQNRRLAEVAESVVQLADVLKS